MSLIITQGYGISAGGGSFSVSSVTPYVDHVDILFTESITLTGIAADYTNWTFTGSTTIPIVATSVSVVGATVSVYFNEGHNGDTITLHMPYAGIFWVTTPYADVLDFNFTCVGVAPTIYNAIQQTARTVLVNFSEAVKSAQATDTANWAFTGSYTVDSVAESTPSSYILTLNSPLASSTSYTVTASNIEDLAGNLV